MQDLSTHSSLHIKISLTIKIQISLLQLYYHIIGDVSVKACGLIVEYNPFHNGHLYHVKAAKEKSKANCMIAVMSGSFLQRGEPAIIDKFHRAKAALSAGVDIVIELPYPYAVQSSRLFAKGAVHSLHEIGVENICFGSESGNITPFLTSYNTLQEKQDIYNTTIRKHLKSGLSYPQASSLAHKKIGLTDDQLDLSKPNNILGFSYVQTILDNKLSIEPLTIKRIKSDFHEQQISDVITSATSIRHALLEFGLNQTVKETMPSSTLSQLQNYERVAKTLHDWEKYFPFIHYRVSMMTIEELAMIQGMDEGLEYRMKQTAKGAVSFQQWMDLLKTKRYTWTRLQRTFVHLLTNTKKTDIQMIEKLSSVPYVRLLGLTKTGQSYLNTRKKDMNIPIISKISRDMPDVLAMEEKASDAYYSILSPTARNLLRQQDFKPILLP